MKKNKLYVLNLMKNISYQNNNYNMKNQINNCEAIQNYEINY